MRVALNTAGHNEQDSAEQGSTIAQRCQERHLHMHTPVRGQQQSGVSQAKYDMAQNH